MEVRIRRIKPVKASPAVSRRVRHHCEAILEAGPGNEAGNRIRLDLEHLLLRLLHGAGLRGVERVVRDAGVAGLQRVAGDGPGLRRWTTLAAAHQADLMISVWSSKVLRAVSVNWYALPQQPKTRKERELKQLQDQFYARYMEAGDRAYATPPQRISAADRQILLVGELEADVNNGGFNQYLFNKGRRRAAAALRALDAIGATGTAAMLRAAMAASTDEDTLQKLDSKFYRSREDLAVLAIKKLGSVVALVLAVLCWTAAAAGAQTTIRITAADGGTIAADEYGRGQRPSVILAHGGRFDRTSWKPQAQALAAAGFRVIAIDFRAAVEARAGREGGCLYDDACLVKDVLAAIGYLKRSGAGTIAIVGGSLGGGAAARAAVDAPSGDIDAVVLLAHMPIESPERMRGRKLFIVASDDRGGDNAPRLEAIRQQFERAPEPKELLVVDGAAHAQALFDTAEGPRVMREILRFLRVP